MPPCCIFQTLQFWLCIFDLYVFVFFVFLILYRRRFCSQRKLVKHSDFHAFALTKHNMKGVNRSTKKFQLNSLYGQGKQSADWDFFSRPSPLGFRQVDQHAVAWNELQSADWDDNDTPSSCKPWLVSCLWHTTLLEPGFSPFGLLQQTPLTLSANFTVSCRRTCQEHLHHNTPLYYIYLYIHIYMYVYILYKKQIGTHREKNILKHLRSQRVRLGDCILCSGRQAHSSWLVQLHQTPTLECLMLVSMQSPCSCTHGHSWTARWDLQIYTRCRYQVRDACLHGMHYAAFCSQPLAPSWEASF